ncbi:hypothetical protein K7X08_004408 [Anisodus acutangulus]|uniref:Uncharacterized protein n=1 Tax=Anisodus acutangulus TaxID=402998 RepID=A0A9Q1MHG0_9SOLA|nr:hypothetical protein K7X08_004408 [Anisodus acutangulus]
MLLSGKIVGNLSQWNAKNGQKKDSEDKAKKSRVNVQKVTDPSYDALSKNGEEIDDEKELAGTKPWVQTSFGKVLQKRETIQEKEINLSQEHTDIETAKWGDRVEEKEGSESEENLSEQNSKEESQILKWKKAKNKGSCRMI